MQTSISIHLILYFFFFWILKRVGCEFSENNQTASLIQGKRDRSIFALDESDNRNTERR